MEKMKYLFVSVTRDFAVIKEKLEASFDSLEVSFTTRPEDGINKYLEHDYALIAIRLDLTLSESFRHISSFSRCGFANLIVLSEQSDENTLSSAYFFGADFVIPYNTHQNVLEAFFTAQYINCIRRMQSNKKSGRVNFSGCVEIYHTIRQVCVNSVPVDLTSRQYDVLCYFIANPDRIITYDELAANVWRNKATTPNNITALVSKLRRIIEPDPENPSFIQTIFKLGYRFNNQLVSSKL